MGRDMMWITRSEWDAMREELEKLTTEVERLKADLAEERWVDPTTLKTGVAAFQEIISDLRRENAMLSEREKVTK